MDFFFGEQIDDTITISAAAKSTLLPVII